MTAGKLVDFDDLDEEIQELIRESINVREKSYSPYSKFKVGAAIRCEDGTIERGCNIENASFPVTICAERATVSCAVSSGKTKFSAIAVAADCVNGSVTTPCGMCRQALAEFGDMPVYLTSPDMKKIIRTSVKELIPFAFGLNGIVLS